MKESIKNEMIIDRINFKSAYEIHNHLHHPQKSQRSKKSHGVFALEKNCTTYSASICTI